MAPIQSDSLAINFEFDIIRKKCIHCGQLILRKISKIGATRCQILRLNSISTGAPPLTTLGELTALPRLQAVFEGPTSKERRVYRGGEGKGMEKEGRVGRA